MVLDGVALEAGGEGDVFLFLQVIAWDSHVPSIYSKIFEKIMKKFLISYYLEAKCVLNPEQFGFRQGLSPLDALSSFTEKIYSTLDSKLSLLSVFIDFTKAFDTVRHDILL